MQCPSVYLIMIGFHIQVRDSLLCFLYLPFKIWMLPLSITHSAKKGSLMPSLSRSTRHLLCCWEVFTILGVCCELSVGGQDVASTQLLCSQLLRLSGGLQLFYWIYVPEKVQKCKLANLVAELAVSWVCQKLRTRWGVCADHRSVPPGWCRSLCAGTENAYSEVWYKVFLHVVALFGLHCRKVFDIFSCSFAQLHQTFCCRYLQVPFVSLHKLDYYLQQITSL